MKLVSLLNILDCPYSGIIISIVMYPNLRQTPPQNKMSAKKILYY